MYLRMLKQLKGRILPQIASLEKTNCIIIE